MGQNVTKDWAGQESVDKAMERAQRIAADNNLRVQAEQRQFVQPGKRPKKDVVLNDIEELFGATNTPLPEILAEMLEIQHDVETRIEALRNAIKRQEME